MIIPNTSRYQKHAIVGSIHGVKSLVIYLEITEPAKGQRNKKWSKCARETFSCALWCYLVLTRNHLDKKFLLILREEQSLP